MTWLTDVRNRYESNKMQRAMVQRQISHRPDLAGRVHILSAKNDDIQAPSMADYVDYASVYEQHVWFYRGVKVLSDNFAPLVTRVVRGDEGEPVDNHPLTQLFDMVNDQYGQNELRAQWLTSIVFSGESFMEIVSGERNRAPLQLWSRRPDRISVIPDAARPAYPLVAGYRWSENENSDLDWEADEMVMWKFNHPINPWRGLSMIGAARHSLTIDIFSQAWSKKFLKQGGNPDWALIAPQGITQTEREAYDRTIEQKFLGWENWHKPIVLEDGVTDIKPLSWAPKDMQWIEQRKLAREEIGAILGVPDVLLGFGPETYDTEEKRKTALRTLWTLTLVPMVQFYDDRLNNFFTHRRPMLKGDERLETDLSVIGILDEDIAPKIESAARLWSMGVPFNVIDERLSLGIGEIEGGDVGYVSFGLVEAGMEPIAFAPRGQQPPPQSQNDEQRAPALIAIKDAQPITKAPEYDSVEHRMIMKARDAFILPYEEQMGRALLKFFQAQQNEIGRRFRDTQQKQESARFPPLESLFDSEEELQRFKELIGPIIEALFEVSGNDAIQLVLGQGGPKFDMRRATVRQAIDYIIELDAMKVNDTTFGGLTELFQQASDEGLSVPNTMDRLSGYFTERKKPYQLERIARTTMISANNAASMAGYEQSGVVESVEWLATLDNRVRDAHFAAHGQKQPLGRAFDVGGENVRYPGDPWASAGNRINCRCTVIAKTYPN